jgi:hypothetical protein
LFDRIVRWERIDGHGRADAANLVGRDGLTQSGAAEQHRPVDLTPSNGLGGLDTDDRVCGLVAGVRDAEVADLSDPRPYITITASDP